MTPSTIEEDLRSTIEEIKNQGLYKQERIIGSPQGATIEVEGHGQVLNFCSNNYLGLADHPAVIQAAQNTMEQWGYGLASVRFICGTQRIHRDLENAVSRFLGTEDTLMYAACFDANGGLFEPLLGQEDAIISDSFNHASIIDGVRLCKAARYRYKHADMDDLADSLEKARDARYRLICTDGVFSMDGDMAPLDEICNLADKTESMVMVDDSHATGYLGPSGRGTPEHWAVQDRVDLVTTTFGKALGGASGGCTSGRKVLIELLRQRSRPYLFSNTLAPAVVGGTMKVLEVLTKNPTLGRQAVANAGHFRSRMEKLGFDLISGDTAIVPIMLYEENLALHMADMLLGEGIYVIGFAYPVVPRGQARIRVQLTAAHTIEAVDQAITAFEKVGRELKVL